MNGNLKFSERLWEWRSFSKVIHSDLLTMIHRLPVKFDRPTKMTDNYVWTPDCNLNIKLREQDLKIKEQIGLQSFYMDSTTGFTTEQWTTEVFSFPISSFLMKRIVKGLKICNPPKTLHTVEDKEQFIELLQSQSNSVRVLSVFKQREQRLLPMNEDPVDIDKYELEDLVTVEISRLEKPEVVSTMSVEHSNIDNVFSAISKMMRDSDRENYSGMKFMNYLEAVKVWGSGKKIFD